MTVVGLSNKEMEVVTDLEFSKKYFFTRVDISKHFKTKNQLRHTIHKLIQKKRIISLNKNKYYMIPLKAKTGVWAEESFTLIDEIMNNKDYFIGDWAAANYWNLTDQIPMKIAVYTTKRQGTLQILTTRIIFKRTTKKRVQEAVTRNILNHQFRILSKEAAREWIKSRD